MKHILLTLVCLLIIAFGVTFPNSVVSAPITLDHEITEKDPVREWINELEKYESETVEDKDNYKRIDTNGKYSYGCMQFQLRTFIGYYEAWKDTSISNYEARQLISDCDRQKDLATWMIKVNPENYSHWWTSVIKRGLGLPPNM